MHQLPVGGPRKAGLKIGLKGSFEPKTLNWSRIGPKNEKLSRMGAEKPKVYIIAVL